MEGSTLTNCSQTQYHLLTEDNSIIYDNKAQVEDNDEKAIFRKEQDFCILTYEGKTIRLRDFKGIHDIQYLLQ